MAEKRDLFFLQQAVKEALKGEYNTAPNPLVGCVIARGDDVISTGYHKAYEEQHAEQMALSGTCEDLSQATMYVTLEPCMHHGKTPPCTDAILASGIQRVVIGMEDPNPIVSGNGIQILREHGVTVEVCEENNFVRNINLPYLTNQLKKRPWVVCKIAQTLDGCIADDTNNSKWITNDESRMAGHMLRKKYRAIVAGAHTVLYDNPQLTYRMSEGKSPVRVIIDPHLKTDPRSKVYAQSGRVMILYDPTCENDPSKFTNGEVVLIPGEFIDGALSISWFLERMYEMGIPSVLVEGGAKTWSAFLAAGLVDEIYIFTAPRILGSSMHTCRLPGLTLDEALEVRKSTQVHLGDDILLHGYLTDLLE